MYKPGYVLWDSRRLCPTDMPRTDFDDNHRTVRLLNFDTETSTWVEKYSKLGYGSGPHAMQESLFVLCYSGGMGYVYPNNDIKFREIFYKYEQPIINKEADNIREKKKTKN